MNDTQRIEISPLPGFPDAAGARLAEKVASEMGLQVEKIRTSRVFYLDGALSGTDATWIAENLLNDPVVSRATINRVADGERGWVLEIGYRPGVTDNEGTIAEDVIGAALARPVRVHTSRCYYVSGSVTEGDVRRIAEEMLANPLIQRIRVDAGGAAARPLLPWNFDPVLPPDPGVREVTLPGDDAALLELSRRGLLALNLEEMRAIQDHFADPSLTRSRIGAGLPRGPTDVELEAIAQTWSEHCKHKIFNDRIAYTEGGETTIIDGLFRTYIRGSTEEIAKHRDWLVSVFEDNAGVIRWSDSHHLVFKVETHNAPSALEPYGGALTGIVGVNRDPAGTGLGARLLFNTDVFCFADPRWDRPLPPGVLHPRRIFAGVRRGVEDGGNQSGVPTVNGGLFFDDRYLGRPLVFCGTGALMPVESAGRPTHLKSIEPGDLVVMAGGRVGKDGIHGATFSSEAITEDTPVGVVQIGDPITQKKLLDMLHEARELGLYRAITDNGAGGLSSSVGEMAQLSGGAVIDLDTVPLKYPGLAPWEILVSESQERMSLAVPPEHADALKALAARRGVEVTVIGKFTDDGRFAARWHGRAVMSLGLELLHKGSPRRTLVAEWCPPPVVPFVTSRRSDPAADLLALLGSLNICSRETVIRQYDHEVQAGTVVKPLVGDDGPSDAAVLRPELDSTLGVAVSSAINPHYGDHDTYWMACLMVDEAVRNAVSVGADPDHLALLDNFCWPDPVHDPVKNPDGPFKLAQLVRTCRGLADATIAFGAPLISGKDSMKNDYHGPGGTKISVPPTLLVSSIARHPDIRRAVTMDAKVAGDRVYVIGVTRAELGGSQYGRLGGATGGAVPRVDLAMARRRYHALHRAIMKELVASCHDCSEGGLAVALAEKAIAGGLGLRIDLSQLPVEGASPLTVEERLFSESASRLVVTVAPSNARRFEAWMRDTGFGCIGEVTETPVMEVTEGRGAGPLFTVPVAELARSWKGGLE